MKYIFLFKDLLKRQFFCYFYAYIKISGNCLIYIFFLTSYIIFWENRIKNIYLTKFYQTIKENYQHSANRRFKNENISLLHKILYY